MGLSITQPITNMSASAIKARHVHRHFDGFGFTGIILHTPVEVEVSRAKVLARLIRRVHRLIRPRRCEGSAGSGHQRFDFCDI
jgi:hypothetical protein